MMQNTGNMTTPIQPPPPWPARGPTFADRLRASAKVPPTGFAPHVVFVDGVPARRPKNPVSADETCRRCGKPGHYAAQCREPEKNLLPSWKMRRPYHAALPELLFENVALEEHLYRNYIREEEAHACRALFDAAKRAALLTRAYCPFCDAVLFRPEMAMHMQQSHYAKPTRLLSAEEAERRIQLTAEESQQWTALWTSVFIPKTLAIAKTHTAAPPKPQKTAPPPDPKREEQPSKPRAAPQPKVVTPARNEEQPPPPVKTATRSMPQRPAKTSDEERPPKRKSPLPPRRADEEEVLLLGATQSPTANEEPTATLKSPTATPPPPFSSVMVPGTAQSFESQPDPTGVVYDPFLTATPPQQRHPSHTHRTSRRPSKSPSATVKPRLPKDGIPDTCDRDLRRLRDRLIEESHRSPSPRPPPPPRAQGVDTATPPPRPPQPHHTAADESTLDVDALSQLNSTQDGYCAFVSLARLLAAATGVSPDPIAMATELNVSRHTPYSPVLAARRLLTSPLFRDLRSLLVAETHRADIAADLQHHETLRTLHHLRLHTNTFPDTIIVEAEGADESLPLDTVTVYTHSMALSKLYEVTGYVWEVTAGHMEFTTGIPTGGLGEWSEHLVCLCLHIADPRPDAVTALTQNIALQLAARALPLHPLTTEKATRKLGTGSTPPPRTDIDSETHQHTPAAAPVPSTPLHPHPARHAHPDEEDTTSTTSESSTDGEEMFRHGQPHRMPPQPRCPVQGCPFRSSEPHRSTRLTDHINGQHPEPTRRALEAATLLGQGLDSCLRCGRVIAASNRARAAHLRACGPYITPYKQRRLEQDAPSHQSPTRNSRHGPPPTRSNTPPQYLLPPDPSDYEWLSSRPVTLRTLHKRMWPQWRQVVAQVLIGYTTSKTEERHDRQLALLNLPRTHLRRPPREGDRDRTPTLEDDPGQPPADDALIRRVKTCLALGAVGKGARLLGSTPLPRHPAAQVADQLRQLHPPEDPSTFPPPPPIPATLTVQPADVQKTVLRQLARAAAPGIDGWTRELLVPLVEDTSLLTELTTLVADIMSCNVSARFANRIRAAAITPLAKDAVKVRPLTPESLWLKLPSLVAYTAVPREYRAVFRPYQYGVWGDAAIAVRAIRDAQDTFDTVVALDGVNAYNTISRRLVLQSVYETPMLSCIWGITALALATPSPLIVYENDECALQLESSRGIRQGMVLGPLLFSAALHAILNPIRTRLDTGDPNSVRVVAYLDDITVIGNAAPLQSCLDELVPALASVGYVVNATKSTVFHRPTVAPTTHVSGTPLPIAPGVTKILGAGFTATHHSLADWVLQQTHKQDAFFDRLRSSAALPASSRMLLLRACGIPRMQHLLRTHAPDDLATAAQYFDGRVAACLESILDFPRPGDSPTLPETAQLLAALPTRHGGLGLRLTSDLAAFASACVGQVGAQKQHTDAVDTTKLARLNDLLSEPVESAMVRAHRSSGANRVLHDPQINLTDQAFRMYLRQRLLLPLAAPGAICVCGKEATNAHINTCPKMATPAHITRHDAIVQCIATWAQQLGFSVHTEPRADRVGKERLDVEIVTPSAVFATDVTVTYPGRLDRSSRKPLSAAYAAKVARWQPWARTANITYAPLAMESTGGLHPASLQWLRSIVGHVFHPYAPKSAMDDILTNLQRVLHTYNVVQLFGLYTS